MSRWISCCCTIIALFLSASLAQAHDYEDCCRHCKEVSDACREGGTTGCKDKYDKCMKECPQQPLLKDGSKGDGTAADKAAPTTKIPEIVDPKKLDELKQKL